MYYASAQMDVKTLCSKAGVKIQQVVISGADASAVVEGTVVSLGNVGRGLLGEKSVREESLKFSLRDIQVYDGKIVPIRDFDS